jgi:DNA polymerase I-like protein with 3'-5' exonuclease and polymerase domains
MKDLTGGEVQLWSARSVANAFDRVNLEYPHTLLGHPSFTQTFLETHKHELPRMVTKARVLNKLQGTFIDGISKYIHNGRLHAHVNQIRGDDAGSGVPAGTVTGRFSMYAPNLQQMPIRSEFGSEVRKIFLPEEGEYWISADYSQQEPRLLTHFAILNKNEGAEDVRQAFIKGLDFHKQTADMADIPRRLAKTIGLGVMYGMGYKKMAIDLDITPIEAKAMLKEFRIKVPFMQEMLEAVMNRANQVGTIRTLLGRKCRFDLYEPNWYEPLKFYKAMPLKQAEAEYGNVKRAGTYKALNRLIQGSAADQTKKAMVDVYEKLGITPLLQMHDELNCSVKSDIEGEDVKNIMENCIKLEVPSKVEYKVKDNWGDAK